MGHQLSNTAPHGATAKGANGGGGLRQFCFGGWIGAGIDATVTNGETEKKKPIFNPFIPGFLYLFKIGVPRKAGVRLLKLGDSGVESGPMGAKWRPSQISPHHSPSAPSTPSLLMQGLWNASGPHERPFWWARNLWPQSTPRRLRTCACQPSPLTTWGTLRESLSNMQNTAHPLV